MQLLRGCPWRAARQGRQVRRSRQPAAWLLKHHGRDHYLEALRSWNSHRGQAGGVAFAEG